VVEAMMEVRIDYPGEFVESSEVRRIGYLLEGVDEELRDKMQEVIADVREKFEVLRNLNDLGLAGEFSKCLSFNFVLALQSFMVD
jgi:hypothetical protein